MKEKKIRNKIGNEIRRLRLERDLSQQKLAEITGIHRTYMGVIERGEKTISIYKLYQILESLDTSLQEFFKQINL